MSADRRRAAHVLRRILNAVETGELEATDAQSRRLAHRLEGVVSAWESNLKKKPKAVA